MICRIRAQAPITVVFNDDTENALSLPTGTITEMDLEKELSFSRIIRLRARNGRYMGIFGGDAMSGFRFSGASQGVSEGEFSGDVGALNLAIGAAQATADSAFSAAQTAQTTVNSTSAAAAAAQATANGSILCKAVRFDQTAASPVCLGTLSAGAWITKVQIDIAATSGNATTSGNGGIGIAEYPYLLTNGAALSFTQTGLFPWEHSYPGNHPPRGVSSSDP